MKRRTEWLVWRVVRETWYTTKPGCAFWIGSSKAWRRRIYRLKAFGWNCVEEPRNSCLGAPKPKPAGPCIEACAYASLSCARTCGATRTWWCIRGNHPCSANEYGLRRACSRDAHPTIKSGCFWAACLRISHGFFLKTSYNNKVNTGKKGCFSKEWLKGLRSMRFFCSHMIWMIWFLMCAWYLFDCSTIPVFVYTGPWKVLSRATW